MLDIKVRARAAAGERRYLIKIIAKLQLVSRQRALRLRNAAFNPHQSGDTVAAKCSRYSNVYRPGRSAFSLFKESKQTGGRSSLLLRSAQRPPPNAGSGGVGRVCVAVAADIWPSQRFLPVCFSSLAPNCGGVFGRSQDKLS